MGCPALMRIFSSFIILAIIAIFVLTTFYTVYPPSSLCRLNIYSSFESDPNSHVCCLILTTPKYFLSRAKAIQNTWGPRCDRHVFISELSNGNMTKEQIEYSKQLPIAPIVNLSTGYRRLTEKSMLGLLFVNEHYSNDCQWFVKADDDTYLIVDHLKLFLSKQKFSEPVTFGFTFNDSVPGGFHSGGASYVLSREALNRLAVALKNSTGQCRRDAPAEDVEIARCLRTLGVYPGRSLDEHNLEMFHPLTFTQHFLGQIPVDIVKYAENPPQTGYNCCSEHSVSFHYVSPEEQYFMDFLLYRARSSLLSSHRDWAKRQIRHV